MLHRKHLARTALAAVATAMLAVPGAASAGVLVGGASPSHAGEGCESAPVAAGTGPVNGPLDIVGGAPAVAEGPQVPRPGTSWSFLAVARPGVPGGLAPVVDCDSAGLR